MPVDEAKRKYNLGYNRGYTRASDERLRLAVENSDMRRFLRELDDLNRQCDEDWLPPEMATRLRTLIGE